MTTSPIFEASRQSTFHGLWDWRRRICELYGALRIQAEPRAAWTVWRDTRDRLFAAHPQSPIVDEQRAAFTGLPYFDYDPALRFVVPLQTLADGWTHRLDVGADGKVELTAFAITEGLGGSLGAELTLYWIGGYGGGVFLPFRDASSGETTYGGGRYLLDTIKGADLGWRRDGRLLLDFNFAYNPSCAYSTRWTCPLAPEENSLPFTVAGGEKKPQSFAARDAA